MDSPSLRLMFAYEPTDGSGIYMGDPIALDPSVDPDPEEFDPMVYDTSGNGEIERVEVIAAITDYFKDLIERVDVIEVIKTYFTSD